VSYLKKYAVVPKGPFFIVTLKNFIMILME